MSFNKIFRLVAALDREVLSTAAYRLWTVGAGGLTLILVPIFLNQMDQGYYFTFLSLLALQIFFELGLSQVIVQLVAHKSIGLKDVSWMSINGTKESVDALHGLARLVHKWYALAGSLFFFFVGVCGCIYLRYELTVPEKYLIVWLILCGCTALNLTLSAKLAVLDGLGFVVRVASIRTKQSMIGYLLAWTGLVFSGGIYAMVFIPLTAVVYGLYSLRGFSGLCGGGPQKERAVDLSWRRDIFPMQWRIALSWMSGYFMFQIFTPVIFRFHGPIEAGRVGMALSAFSAIQSIGMSWVTAKVPVFSQLIAKNNRSDLDQLFGRLFKQAILFTTAFSSLVVAGALIVSSVSQLPIFQRLASPVSLLILGLVSVTNLCVYCWATYMRAHNEEPMTPVSVVSAILTALVTFVAAPFGSEAVLLGYLCVSAMVTLPWTKFLFNKRSGSGVVSGMTL
jgi:hypothetical protein